jgi:uncharacterized protein (TIGR00730 family)
MEQIWLDQLKQHKELTLEDVERSVRYSKDLLQGLAVLKSYKQGVTIFGSARLPESDPYYQAARKLGQRLAESGHSVITGGGNGIMEAANRGAFEAGGKSIGLNIELPNEQTLNPYTTDNLEFHYFFARKVMLTFSSMTFVYFPGGFGTLDEFSEILTLVQTKKIPPVPIILFGMEFWHSLDEFFRVKMAEQMKTIGANDRSLYTITDDIDYIISTVNQLTPNQIKDAVEQTANLPSTDHRGVVV